MTPITARFIAQKAKASPEEVFDKSKTDGRDKSRPCGNLAILIFLILLLNSCAPSRAPVPPGEIPALQPVTASDEEFGHDALSELLERYQLETEDAKIDRVRNLVDKLVVPLNAQNEPWHVYVLHDDTMKNAAATRGNHVFVWSGLLDVIQNDTELATVIAHEIGHILAQHPIPSPAEETSVAVSGVAGVVTREIVAAQGSFGILAGLAQVLVEESLKAVMVNPEQQRKELEADLIGLHLMAQAGFDPRGAVEFWERVQDNPDFSGSSIAFLSSHPSSSARLDNLRRNLPAAMDRFNGHTAPPNNGGPGSVRAERPISPETNGGRRSIGAQRPISPETWKVIEPDTQVYQAPDSSSPVLDRLRRGDRVVIVSRSGRWLLLQRPVRGWVMGSNLSP